MTYFCHPHGICESSAVGNNTRIWAFAHVLPGARIGEDCNICDHVFIENKVVLGNRVTVKCGVQLWDGLIIEDDVFIGPNATFTNDPFPPNRGRDEEFQFQTTRVCRRASIGANATILPGITIGQNAMISAGAVVTRSVPPNAIVIGNPARVVGYAGLKDSKKRPVEEIKLALPHVVEATCIEGVTFHHFQPAADPRGDVIVSDFERDLPFIPRRYFLVINVPSSEVRGEYAHRICHQFLLCIKGSCSVVADDGQDCQEFLLQDPHTGMHFPPMTWGVQYKFSADAVLLVFASHTEDNADYIRDYEQFLAELNSRQSGHPLA